jgi:pimeloyl-ACP methyl ester carboxylesterase
MLPLADLANSGDRAVIFYDQLGNGHSTHLRHKPREFWTIDLFISELINLSEKLKISSRYVLAGHSWGGILGLELLLRRPPPGLLSFICLSGLASIPRYVEEYNKLLSKFPKEVQEGMGMQKTDMKRFREANDRFDEVHTIQVVPFPKEHVDSMDSIWGPEGDDTVIEHL